MTPRISGRNSVRTRLLRSWLILGASTIAASVLLLMLLLFVERNNQGQRMADDLQGKAVTVARRLSAELLVGERGTIDPVIQGLKQELNIDTIILLPSGMNCTTDSQQSPCRGIVDSSVWTTARLPQLPADHFVLVAQPKTSLSSAVPWLVLTVAMGSLLAVLLSGIVFQWSAIRKHILRPINALLESGKKDNDPSRWPIEIQKMADKLQSLLAERDKATTEAHRLKTETFIHDLSQRILHDLKAPLGTLGIMIETDLAKVPTETKDSMRRVLGRIRAIVDSNLKEYSADVLARVITPSSQPTKIEKATSTVGGAVRTIISEEESKAALRGVKIVSDLQRSIYQTFAPISFSELSRVFSNLVANAVDSAERGQKKVFISAQRSSEFCEVSIRDFGAGFDPQTLTDIQSGQRRTTKANGNGLGLITAKSIVEQAGGQLTIQNFPDGVLIRVRLPILKTPSWFHDITSTSSKSILALDDDATMAQQLSSLFPEKRVSVFKTEKDFLANTANEESALLLVDYDFGGEQNGLDLIINQGLTRRAVLLSGRIAFDPKIRATAEANSVRMFPKECLA